MSTNTKFWLLSGLVVVLALSLIISNLWFYQSRDRQIRSLKKLLYFYGAHTPEVVESNSPQMGFSDITLDENIQTNRASVTIEEINFSLTIIPGDMHHKTFAIISMTNISDRIIVTVHTN